MRVAALYDIHSNAIALRAVLAELEREHVDLIVVGGDAVPGPLPAATIDLLRSLHDPAVYVRGNTDRWTIEEFDARAGTESDERRVVRPAAAWTATMIDRRRRDFLASFQDHVVIEVDAHATQHAVELCVCVATKRQRAVRRRRASAASAARA